MEEGFPSHHQTILGTPDDCPTIQLIPDTVYLEIASDTTGEEVSLTGPPPTLTLSRCQLQVRVVACASDQLQIRGSTTTSQVPLIARVAYRTQENSFSSVTQSCPTLCDAMDYSTPGFSVRHQLPELAQTHVHQVGNAIQPSLSLSSSPSPPAFSLSQHQGLFQLVSSLHQVAKLLELQR